MAAVNQVILFLVKSGGHNIQQSNGVVIIHVYRNQVFFLISSHRIHTSEHWGVIFHYVEGRITMGGFLNPLFCFGIKKVLTFVVTLQSDLETVERYPKPIVPQSRLHSC